MPDSEAPDPALGSLKSAVTLGLEQADRGELEPWDPDEIWAEAERRFAQRRKNALEPPHDQEQFTPEHEAYLRREIRRGMEQLQRGEYSDLTIEQIIAEERSRMPQAEKAQGRQQYRG